MANEERVKQLEKIIKSCIEAGVSFEEYKTELNGLQSQAVTPLVIDTVALVKQAEANQAEEAQSEEIGRAHV